MVAGRPAQGANPDTWGDDLNAWLDATVNGAELGVDHITTQPATPAGGVVLFARNRARRTLSVLGPSGQDTALQPSLFSNRVARVIAIDNSTTPAYDGIVSGSVTHLNNATAVPTAVAMSSSSFYNSIIRYRLSSSTTSGTAGGTRFNRANWFLSSTANMGGFFAVFRVGLGAVTTTNRIFIGLSSSTAALSATTNPSAFTNAIGFMSDSSNTTLRVGSNGASGTAVTTDLGASFPTTASPSTYFLELRLFAPSGGGSNVYWSAQRLNDGAVAVGQITTGLPALGTLLTPHVHHSNGTTGAAVSIDVQQIYIETDN